MSDATESPEVDFDNMSDEDFLNLDPIANGIGAPDMSSGPSTILEDTLGAPDAAGAPEALEGDDAEDDDDEGAEAGAPAETQEDGDQPSDDAAQVGAGDDEDHTTPHQSAAAADKTAAPAAPAEAPNYETLYKQLMAPFKANGKEFSPSSPDEAVRLMQMGANYTRKMQALAPNLKLMRMLENNGLLQEDKLAFLIDLNRKEPAAITKLLHDGKIDPLDLDVSSEPAYTPGNHSVSDKEMAFHDALGTVMQSPSGKDTVSHINTQWDQDSKQAIYAEPQLLEIIDTQRSNGLYAKITAELEREKILGKHQNTPFIVAYKEVGDRLFAEGKLTSGGSQVAPVTPGTEQPRPVLETRPASRKPTVSNGDKARAISPAPRAAKPATKVSLDPFSMTDAEIMALSSLKV